MGHNVTEEFCDNSQKFFSRKKDDDLEIKRDIYLNKLT